jgi:hypothetical protein
MRATVRTEVLEAALRGGEPARLLAAQCGERRAAADAALAATLRRAPAVVAESRERSSTLRRQQGELSADLDALSTSLDVLVESSEKISARSLVAKEKLAALDDLGRVLAPMVIVSEAICDAESAEPRDVARLHETLVKLENATRVASEHDLPQLLSLLPTLQGHVSETTAMMQFRFLDLVAVAENSVTARTRPRGGGDGRTSPADALAKAGLLDEALRAIVTELRKKSVAEGLRGAPVFVSTPGGGGGGPERGPSLGWSVDGAPDGELLEFDFDDLDDVPDEDVDAMTAALDISNAASRAIAVFDLIRDNVVGDAHSAALAAAFHPWIVERLLPVGSVSMSLRGQYEEDGVPPVALRARVLALSASARVLEAAMHSRGADPSRFVIDVDVGSMEDTVAGECRGLAVLAARRAIGSFADARHNASQIVPCPLSAHVYVPRPERGSDYFPPCLVSQSATAVLDVFSRARTDGLQAMAGGSTVIGAALIAAGYECIDAYRVDVPLQHGEDMRASLRLKALYYNDCMMLKHACQRADAMDKEQVSGGEGPAASSEDMLQVSTGLAKAAEAVMLSVRRTAERGLMDNLSSACRNGALGAYGTLTRIQRSSALTAAYNAVREVVEVFADTVPTEIAVLAAASLCEKYIRKLCDAVADLDEILPNGCEQIDSILEDAVDKTRSLMRLVNGKELRNDDPPPEIAARLEAAQRRADAYRHVVTARMEDIVSRYREGAYGDGLDRAQVETFLLKIFEDTPLRASFIKELDVSPEAEAEEWGDQEW